MHKRETVATIALALLTATLMMNSMGAYNDRQANSLLQATPITCQEDMACWDCRSMGNLVCGPDNAQGVPSGDYTK